MEHEDLTRRIIGVAYEVHREMKSGFLESVYEQCMMIALKDAGIRALRQHPITVHFRNQPVGKFVADLVVEDVVLLELKSVIDLVAVHEVQLVNYLNATKIPVGLLLNFGAPSLQIKRKTLASPIRPARGQNQPSDPVGCLLNP